MKTLPKLTLLAAALTLATPLLAQTAAAPRPIKAVVITMFAPEAEGWVKPFKLDERIPVPGLFPDYPAIQCNTDDVCLLTTGMGHANAAASTLALTLDPRFDFTRTWFLIAGIAGIDPQQGTLGTAAWARWLIDFGIAHEIDAREMPRAGPPATTACSPRAPARSPSSSTAPRLPGWTKPCCRRPWP
ncbi:purine nucleoside permease [Aquincola sp. J276]|nr:purine nucleoside permease [Aquincola sp. J276]MCR5866304.1 purine nucleoside permease [Aquincola sp. J276]